jgi:K+-sensing histidine kinase KdpD
MPGSALKSRRAGYVLGILGIAMVTAALRLLGSSINTTTVALAMLLVVLFVATGWGSRPAVVVSVFGVFCLNFFFLPPVHTLDIAQPDNWIALIAFLITAVTAGELSARVTRRAAEAEAARLEIERLYDELRAAFERASHAEALRQSEKLKSALLDAVTHDLRTPLTSIKASVTTLLDDLKTTSAHSAVLDEEGRKEMLEIINEECDRLNRFIEGLVELARIEAGDLQLRRRWGTVDEMIEMALARANPLVAQHTVQVDIQSELPVVLVDARAVSEVIYTLVDNAAKYSPSGTIIHISASRALGDMIRITVEDRGGGVAPDLRDRVFDKFFRAIGEDHASRSQPPGTGMGLSIAKGIVDAHGGRIWIESGEAGTGTRVVFELPIGDEDEADGSRIKVVNEATFAEAKK